ncbi:MAG: GntR family transcriptional regulator [Paracoccaceae bacterium]
MADFGIAKIDQSKLREEVYKALHDAFTRGEFGPGAVLNLRALADQLGTSMTPVREAVRRLVAEGALVDTPSRTLEVPQFDIDRMLDLKRARLALETMVLDIAIDEMDDAAISLLDDVLNAAPGAVVDGPDLRKNYDFHFLLYHKSGSQVMLPLIRSLWLQYGAYLNLIIRQKGASEVDEHEHHLQIIDALRERDRTAARAALTADIERSFHLISVEPNAASGGAL